MSRSCWYTPAWTGTARSNDSSVPFWYRTRIETLAAEVEFLPAGRPREGFDGVPGLSFHAHDEEMPLDGTFRRERDVDRRQGQECCRDRRSDGDE